MRKVCGYSFFQDVDGGTDQMKVKFGEMCDLIRSWLEQKGIDCEFPTGFGAKQVSLKGGRPAECSLEVHESEVGAFLEVQLTEPIQDGTLRFRTTLGVCRSGLRLSVYCFQWVFSSGYAISPVEFNAHRPSVIKTILDSSGDWCVGGSRLSQDVIKCRGQQGGEAAAEMIRDSIRSVPIVAVSEDQGFLLHPNIDKTLCEKLQGLANVISLDEEASWELTRRLGATWSCFSAAIRVYWPKAFVDSNPFAHPLWTASRLVTGGLSTEQAAARIVEQLRRQLMAVASFSVIEPIVIGAVRSHIRRRENEDRLAQAQSADEYRKLAEQLFEQLEGSEARVCEVTEAKNRLEVDLLNERLMRQATSAGDTEICPVGDTPPETVQQAFDRAVRTLSDDLVFGKDCPRGVEGLAGTAGPPEKILNWLETLAALSRSRQSGQLGKSFLQWLGSKGVTASGEDPRIESTRSEKSKRTWDAAGKRDFFSEHLKVNEGTSPDKCVRIYFKWSDSHKKIIVGWIGRHP